MIEFDKETYGAEWLPKEKRNFYICAGAHMIWFLFMVRPQHRALRWLHAPPHASARTLLTRSRPAAAQLLRPTEWDGKAHIPGAFFWLRQAVMNGGLAVVFVSAGLMHVVGGMNSGYTRKICHLALFASSPLMLFLWPYKSSTPSEAQWATLWTVWTSYLMFYLLIKPVRRRLTLALLCFRALDREQDRPHSLEWLITQGVAGMIALVAVMIFMSSAAHGNTMRLILVMIPILINGVGDGLAEPVGITWGRHKYRTRAIWYHGKCCSGSFTRSLEVRSQPAVVARASDCCSCLAPHAARG